MLACEGAFIKARRSVGRSASREGNEGGERPHFRMYFSSTAVEKKEKEEKVRTGRMPWQLGRQAGRCGLEGS